MAVKVFKVEWHSKGLFYIVRGKRLKDVKSLKKMRIRIMSIKNAEWKWHIVLTFDNESLNHYFRQFQDVGKALASYFGKIRSKFWGVKYFWKYEETVRVWCKKCGKRVDFLYDTTREGYVICSECGNVWKSEGERPHYHVLFDFVNRGIRCKKDKIDDMLKRIRKVKVKKTEMTTGTYLLEWKEKKAKIIDLKKLIFPKGWSNYDWKKKIAQWLRFKRNWKKNLLEIFWGYYHYLKWGHIKFVKGKSVFMANGRTDAVEIKTYYALKQYVVKDFFKHSESKWLKDPDKRKWTHSQNLIYIEKAKPSGGWERVLDVIGEYDGAETLSLLGETKDELISYYDKQGLEGSYIYDRIIKDVNGIMVKPVIRVKTQQQVELQIHDIGKQIKCRYCDKLFDSEKGVARMYCSVKCLNLLGKHFEYEREKKEIERREIERKSKGA